MFKDIKGASEQIKVIQVSAINSALNSFSKELLASHMKSCVVNDIRAGKDEVIDELVTTLQKIMK
ncbi:MAG: metal-sensing transcriptional repressor [Oscillospiraceae bacterium]|nr:metal-sensing transcriptional repressor [Oscillospiraceae bacterium]